MRLRSGLHLAYCTNVHRGESWEETFSALQRHTLPVRDRVSPNEPFAIGLRLSDEASRSLIDPETLHGFRRWLQANNCYVFTINGFPFGRFHGAAVKERVFMPDWTRPERLDYTRRLFDILAVLLPDDVEGSVSTLPGSFKEFVRTESEIELIHDNLWRCVDHIAALSERTGHKLHLGLEPEPFGLFENTSETLDFFAAMEFRRPGDPALARHLGINYDTCHFAIQFEEPAESLNAFHSQNIKLSKIHLSSALKAAPDPAILASLRGFADDVYLHQVVAQTKNRLIRYKDLPVALGKKDLADEWRIHFHIPLYAEPAAGLGNTVDHLLGTLDWLAHSPEACAHLEMETYTWEVLPMHLRSADVVEQLTREYEWIFPKLTERGLA